jgi:hypothetical protein
LGFTRSILRADGMKYLALRYSDHAANLSREDRQRELDEVLEDLRRRNKEIITEDPMAPFSHMLMKPGGADVDRWAIKGDPNYVDVDQLDNVNSDPYERDNLYANPDYATVRDELRAALTQQLEKLPGGYAEFVSK